MMNDVSLIRDIDPKATNLEGYLYPTTYQFELAEDPKSIINKMVQQFTDIWQPEWDQLAQKLGKTKREIVIIASLIENESKVDAERNWWLPSFTTDSNGESPSGSMQPMSTSLNYWVAGMASFTKATSKSTIPTIPVRSTACLPGQSVRPANRPSRRRLSPREPISCTMFSM